MAAILEDLDRAIAASGVEGACAYLSAECRTDRQGCAGHNGLCARVNAGVGLCDAVGRYCDEGSDRACTMAVRHCLKTSDRRDGGLQGERRPGPVTVRDSGPGSTLPAGDSAVVIDPDPGDPDPSDPDPGDPDPSDPDPSDPVQPTPTLPPQPAFTGAEGFGVQAIDGGRGGDVIIVDTLAWFGQSGRTGFGDALLRTGRRTIVFEVSGVIEAPFTVDRLTAAHSDLTVAGQTSPGGITFVGQPISQHLTDFHNAIFRFVRFRGNDNWDNVALNGAHHIIFDHCDFSGALEESLDINAGHHITIQWSIIAAGKGRGVMMSEAPSTGISFHHNLTAHHHDYCAPFFGWDNVPTEFGLEQASLIGGALIDLRNNVFYNCADSLVLVVNDPTYSSAEGIEVNLVGNTAIAGPSTPDVGFYDVALAYLPSGASVYSHDNGYSGYATELDLFATYYPEPNRVGAPFSYPNVSTQGREEAYRQVLDRAGSWPRDALNSCVVDDVESRSGQLDDVCFPLLRDGPGAPTDGDRDGLPDSWELERGLNPQDPTDQRGDRDGDGYTNLEEYLNQLAQQRVGEVRHACQRGC